MILLHESPEWLNNAGAQIGAFVTSLLGMKLNPRKTILQPIERGVDFVGQIIKPWHRVLRRTTLENAATALMEKNGEDLLRSANSYLGLLRQSEQSHHARARLARIAIRKGHCVDGQFRKVFRKGRENSNPCASPRLGHMV
jgi:hypothetical protein